MTKTIEDITNFIFIGKSKEELSHYDLLIINADWVEEQLSKDIRIMNDKNIIDIFRENGYEAYAVGGCVRDALLKRIPKDWDITTSA